MQDQFDYRRSNGYSVGRGRHPARVRRQAHPRWPPSTPAAARNPAERGWSMMCTPDGAGCALAAPGAGVRQRARPTRLASVAARAAAVGAYLNSPAAGRPSRPPPAARPWRPLGAITSLLGAAANGILRRFDAGYDHDADGYASRRRLARRQEPPRPQGRQGRRPPHAPARPPPPPRRRHRHRGAHHLVGAGDRRLDRPHRPRGTPGRGGQDPRRGGRRRGGPRRPAGSSRRPPTRPGAPRSPTPTTTPAAAGSATGTCAWRPPWTGPGGSAAT